ncbi:hypothetical protein MtrunA17_Chr4g0029751 [Medicago truncatula]|uniref:Transmembrane protein n=1 Tax=Medicago truncatula TaxID=3880 RepID=A0A396I589_MEDTR|nr:hypothetical protein MtrunA17_Chr4g0029751 [Medicago truncatula]
MLPRRELLLLHLSRGRGVVSIGISDVFVILGVSWFASIFQVLLTYSTQ